MRYGGRCKFGYRRVNGEIVPHEKRMLVLKRIFELRDQGYSLRKIQADDGVHHDDGRDMSVSTLALIVKNRKDYKGYV